MKKTIILCMLSFIICYCCNIAIAYNDNLHLGTIPKADYKITEINSDGTINIDESGSSNIDIELDEYGNVCFVIKQAGDIYFTANIFAVLDILTQMDLIEPGSYRNMILDTDGLTFQFGVSSVKNGTAVMCISNQDTSLILNIETPKQFQCLEETEKNIRKLF